jgi:Tfp pilus assembly protein PilO
MELKKREFVLVYCIAGLLGIGFVSRTVFGPFHAKLLSLSNDILLDEAKLKKGVSLLEKKDDIDKEYGKYASYFSLQNLSDEEAVASFLKEVEKISRATGLVILDMKPQKEAKNDKFSKQYQINIKAEANMEELIKFLYELHNSSILFSVERATLSPKSEDSSDLSIVMTVVGVSFL